MPAHYSHISTLYMFTCTLTVNLHVSRNSIHLIISFDFDFWIIVSPPTNQITINRACTHVHTSRFPWTCTSTSYIATGTKIRSLWKTWTCTCTITSTCSRFDLFSLFFLCNAIFSSIDLDLYIHVNCRMYRCQFLLSRFHLTVSYFPF